MLCFNLGQFIHDGHALAHELDHGFIYPVQGLALIANHWPYITPDALAFIGDGLYHVVECGGGELLCRIAQGMVRVRMYLHHQTVHSKVHGSLCNLWYKASLARNVAGVTDDGEVRGKAPEFKAYFPFRVIAVG